MPPRVGGLLGGVRRGGLAHPGALVVGPALVGHPLGVARAVALDDLEQLGEVDLAELVVPGLVVPPDLRVGQRQPERLGLRHGHVDEPLAQVVVGEPLDPPRHRLRGVRGVVVGRAEHHQRRPPVAVDGVLGHRALGGRAVGEGPEDLEALSLVEGLLLADAGHRPGVRAVGAPAQRHLVGDGGTVDQPADGAHVGPGERRVVEDRGVLLPAAVELVDQVRAVDAQGLGRGVEVEPVPRLVLDLRHQDRLALEARCAADPVALRLHPDDLGVRVLGDLADQGPAIALGHLVARLDPVLVGQQVDEGLGVEVGRARGHLRPLAGRTEVVAVHVRHGTRQCDTLLHR